ncbi:hypothetical protein U1Q18_011608, partial [Sarracenia purpurea var. burkii]
IRVWRVGGGTTEEGWEARAEEGREEAQSRAGGLGEARLKQGAALVMHIGSIAVLESSGMRWAAHSGCAQGRLKSVRIELGDVAAEENQLVKSPKSEHLVSLELRSGQRQL